MPGEERKNMIAYQGATDAFRSFTIDLNIKYLRKGKYEIRIINNKKIVEIFHFEN